MEISSAGSSFSTSVSSSFNQQQQQQQENLIRRQQEFEHKMLDRGAKRFRDQLAKDKKQHRESSSRAWPQAFAGVDCTSGRGGIQVYRRF